MITKKDMIKIETRLEKKFATKEELKATERYLEYKIDTLAAEFHEFKEEMYKFRDSVLKSLDWLVGAFQKFDQEHTILNMQTERGSSLLEQQEARITVCEDKLGTN